MVLMIFKQKLENLLQVVMGDIVTALNFTVLAKTGPLPLTHIPKDRSYVASKIMPFGTNLMYVEFLSARANDLC